MLQPIAASTRPPAELDDRDRDPEQREEQAPSYQRGHEQDRGVDRDRLAQGSCASRRRRDWCRPSRMMAVPSGLMTGSSAANAVGMAISREVMSPMRGPLLPVVVRSRSSKLVRREQQAGLGVGDAVDRRMRPSTRSKASRVSARSSATISQRPLVVCSVSTAGSPRSVRSTFSARLPSTAIGHQCRDAMFVDLRLQADRVAGDRAVPLELRDAVLHRAARDAQLLRERGHRRARIGAQQRDQPPVEVVHASYR